MAVNSDRYVVKCKRGGRAMKYDDEVINLRLSGADAERENDSDEK